MKLNWFVGIEQPINVFSCCIFARDEYKEFEKLIQEDLKEVDNRMEEEEVMIPYLILLLELTRRSMLE